MEAVMIITFNTRRIAVRSGLLTVLYLVGGLMVGVLTGSLVHFRLPEGMAEATRIALAALPALAGTVAGGALWGHAMAQISGAGETKRMTWAGGLGFGPAVILTALVLTFLEVVIVERSGGPALPIHIVFTILFVPAAFFIAGVGSSALGIALKDWRLAIKLALGGGLAAALAFLGVNLLMDALGWRVGAPGAAERATMVTVLMAGNLAAALAGGAVVGVLLSRYSVTPTDS
jgi:hypothetical protein